MNAVSEVSEHVEPAANQQLDAQQRAVEPDDAEPRSSAGWGRRVACLALGLFSLGAMTGCADGTEVVDGSDVPYVPRVREYISPTGQPAVVEMEVNSKTLCDPSGASVRVDFYLEQWTDRSGKFNTHHSTWRAPLIADSYTPRDPRCAVDNMAATDRWIDIGNGWHLYSTCESIGESDHMRRFEVVGWPSEDNDAVVVEDPTCAKVPSTTDGSQTP
jgi:hypothetical protein